MRVCKATSDLARKLAAQSGWQRGATGGGGQIPARLQHKAATIALNTDKTGFKRGQVLSHNWKVRVQRFCSTNLHNPFNYLTARLVVQTSRQKFQAKNTQN